jgi:hypothetical protein
VEERPDYSLFENNCQNFVKYLHQTVCPSASIPATIQNVLERLQTSRQRLSLPGAYPASISSTDRVSFVTASGTSWVTASGDTWVTAVDCRLLRDSNSQLYDASFTSTYRSFRESRSPFDEEAVVSRLIATTGTTGLSTYEQGLARKKWPTLQPYRLVVVGGNVL